MADTHNRATPSPETDVCIVGAGIAGVTLAQELARHGLSVCLLEAGGRHLEEAAQAASRGESDGYPFERLERSRLRAFGGTLRHHRIEAEGWAARRMDAVDFESIPGSPGSGWPFGIEELRPAYERAEALCGMTAEVDVARDWWSRASNQVRGLLHGDLEGALFQFRQPTFDAAWDALHAEPRVSVLLHTRATDLELDRHGRVVSVFAIRNGHEQIVVRPRVTVLATGGIENARRLLLADGGHGLGNDNDLVGRHFAERLFFYGGHLARSAAVSLNDFACLFQSTARVGGGLRLTDQCQRDRGLLDCLLFLVPRPAAAASTAVRSLSTLSHARARRPKVAHRGYLLRHAALAPVPLAGVPLGRIVPRPSTLMLRVQGEPLPRPESRITLGHAVDDLGQRVARAHWVVGEQELNSARCTATLLGDALRHARLGRLTWTGDQPTMLVEGQHHHMGTTRMHDDPRHGVVDADSGVHGVPGLYVTGSSVFPRYGASNPTLTVMALAIRLADHLAASLGPVVVTHPTH